MKEREMVKVLFRGEVIERPVLEDARATDSLAVDTENKVLCIVERVTDYGYEVLSRRLEDFKLLSSYGEQGCNFNERLGCYPFCHLIEAEDGSYVSSLDVEDEEEEDVFSDL